MIPKEQIQEWARIARELSEKDGFGSVLIEDDNTPQDTYRVDEIRDRQEIINLLPDVIEMVKTSYKDGYKGVLELRRLSKTTPLLKIVRDNNGNLMACVIYRAVEGSFKATGAGQNKTDEGKKALQEIIKSDIEPYTNWCWCEVSGAMEHYFKKYNGYPLPNTYAAMVLKKPTEKIELDDDGFHYKRVIGSLDNDEPERKVIYGFKNRELAEEVMSKADYEVKRAFFNNESLHENNENEPEDFHYAVSFVDQLSDLYDEEGFRSLTPGLSSELDSAIDILTKYKNYEDWVHHTLDNALNLKELMPQIQII